MDQRQHPSSSTNAETEELIEHLAGDGHCPLCGAAYGAEGIRVVREYESRWILSVHCHCCGTGSMITAAVPSPFYSTCQSKTELMPEELLSFANVRPVNTDDVLDMHVYLRQFQGDFSSLDLG
jgi:hypothetical protein